MRVRFNKVHEQHGPGTVTELPDEAAKAAIDAGAAEELQRVRLTADWRDGGRWYPAQMEHDLTAEQVKAARKAKALPDEDDTGHHATRKRAHGDKETA